MKKIFISVLLLFCGSGRAQSYLSKLYTVKDGLGSTDIRCMLADKNGFLWIATASGLNCFDGNFFQKFYSDPTDSTSIGDNRTQKLFIDAQDRLWIGTNAGLSLYHPRTRSFSNYYVDTSLIGQQGTTYEAICNDADDNIWIGTKNGLLVFNSLTKTFSATGWLTFATAAAPPNANRLRIVVKSLSKKSNSELWVLSSLGLFSVNTATRTFRYYPNKGIDDYYGFKIIGTDSSNNLWLSSYTSGLFVVNPQTNSWTLYALPGNNFLRSFTEQSVAQYAPDTLVYCAGNGFRLFSQKDRKPLPPLLLNDSAVAKNSANAISQSVYKQQNTLWLSADKGLLRFTVYDNPFHFTAINSKYSVDRIYALGNTGCFLFSAFEKNEPLPKTYLQTVDKKIKPVFDPDGKNIDVYGQYLAMDKDGVCYINDDKHLYRYNAATNTTINIRLANIAATEKTFTFKRIVIDRDKNVWVRSPELGIFKYDAAANTFDFAKELPQKHDKETDALYYDSLSNCIWYAQEFDGVSVYNRSTKSTRHYNLERPPSQRSAAIIYISGNGKGKVWLSDLEAGLIEYDDATKTFTRFTEANGLPDNNIAVTVYDFADALWINTGRGLCKYLIHEKKFIPYLSTGFPVSIDRFPTAGDDGTVYMPFQQGYYTWNAARMKEAEDNGKLYLQEATLFDKRLPLDTVYQFSYGQNNIRFLFGLLSFTNDDAIKMTYSLNGGEWVTTDLHASISFANLSPGKYNLLVKIKNENASPYHIRFEIKKAFWQTAWFIALFCFLALVATIYFIRLRMSQFKKQTALRQQVMESEMSALRSQMNPHFIFNTLNSINSYIIENKNEEASDYLTEFSKLIRLMLQHSRQETILLQDELNAVKLYLELECKRLGQNFDYTILLKPNDKILNALIPSMIIQPFAENAIWHGLRTKAGDKHILIAVEELEKGIQIIVEDNGIGRAAAASKDNKRKDSFGMASTIKRLQLFDAGSQIKADDLTDKERKAIGTRITITFKKMQHENDD